MRISYTDINPHEDREDLAVHNAAPELYETIRELLEILRSETKHGSSRLSSPTFTPDPETVHVVRDLIYELIEENIPDVNF